MKYLVSLFRCPALAVSLAGMLFMLGACSKTVSEQSTETDANGFMCMACKDKMVTGKNVFPTVCPKCKKASVVEVVGFVCSHDNHVTIVPRGPNAVPCEKCKQTADKLKLPREKELIAWGAQKRTAAEVGSP